MLLGTPVEEATVLLPNVLPHDSPVVDEAHEALDPEGRPCDVERGHLVHAKSTTRRHLCAPVNATSILLGSSFYE